MALLQDDDFDLFDACFISFEWNSLTVTPSVVHFTPTLTLTLDY